MTATPIPTIPTIPLDERPIDEMPFEGGDATRGLLRHCNVTVAHEIELLGCTGASFFGLTINQITELRLGLGGGGVGLPCFVPIERFCLAHNTIGGLQEGQAQHYPTRVAAVSRDLTKEERGKIELIEAARRKQGKTLNERLMDTGDILSGREMPKGFEPVEGGHPAADDDVRRIETERRAEVSLVPPMASWECAEHKKTNWACRFCAAQAIVEGPFSVSYALRFDAPDEANATGLTAEEMHVMMERLDAEGLPVVDVYAFVARFTRRLAREE